MTKNLQKHKANIVVAKVGILGGFVKKYNSQLLLGLIVALCAFLRLYDLNNLSPFGFDQVNNAWAAEHIIVNHQYPLQGFEAKGNSGLYIGPLYYYLISIVYFITALDPIASGIFAGLTSIFSVVIIYIIGKKIFSKNIAIIAIFINTVAFFGITFDRVQGPVNFTPAISLIVFYSLYKIINGNRKFILLLAIAVGLSFHIHFSSLFYIPIIMLTLPFFPRDKKTLKYIGMGSALFLIFLIPMLISFFSNMQYGSNVTSYGNSYYHGLHFRRVVQLFRDAFIQFESYLTYPLLKPFSVVFLPLFTIFYLKNKFTKKRFLLCYLMGIFFIVPWIVLSTFSGEISDYYFSTTRYLALLIISYFIYKIYAIKSMIPKIMVVVVLLIFAYFNINEFLHSDTSNSVKVHRERALRAVDTGQKIEFAEGVADSYFYFYYMLKKGVKVY